MNQEHYIQSACVRWANSHTHVYPVLQWLHAIPNGGQRHIAVAMKLKAEGVKKGVFDLFLPYPVGRYHGLYIEVKSEKGTLTDEQKEFKLFAEGWGYAVAVIRSPQEFVDVMVKYLGQPKE